MNTYAEIKAQIAELERKAKAVRATELASAKARIAEIMSAYGLTLADLRNGAKVKSPRIVQPVAAKYRNDATGESWSGRGRTPRWLRGKNKDEFLIH
jgi:DNA-binding protein H-NS